MSKYCITAARPKDAAHHLNSEFKLWRAEKMPDGEWNWVSKNWKRAAVIAELLEAGHEVLTAREDADTIAIGAAVELELRIAKNETNFRISDMPNK